jgi:uncharacterized protein (TIGR02270 family)
MIPAIITPLILRHVTDAAFYWLQLDQSETAFRLPFERVMLFNERLEAHLEGLVIAGSEGIDLAFAELDRWRKPGEAFVGAWLAGFHADEAALSRLTKHLVQQPDALLRGAISAIARLPEDSAQALINRWSQADALPPLQVAALRALALRGMTSACALEQPLTAFMQSTDPFVRASACRVLARSEDETSQSLLHDALHDEEREVRAEAALALTGTDHFGKAASVLWHCVNAQAEIHRNATGWYRMQAQRRLDRWLRYLAWLAPLGYQNLPVLFDYLPARASLSFALYHGDLAYLPRVVNAMRHPETDRYAGWVWQTLTGIDLASHGLILETSDSKADFESFSETGFDGDTGLPVPDADAIETYPIHTQPGVRTLLGRSLTPTSAFELLTSAPQAIRAIAAHAIRQSPSAIAPNIRANAATQQLQMDALRAQTQL